MIHTLEADGIMLQIDGKPILQDIYIHCETKKITGIIGRNGVGKTCLLNVVYGCLKASYKSVRFDGKHYNFPFCNPELIKYLPQFNFIPKQLTINNIFSTFNVQFADFVQLFPEFQLLYNCTIGSLSAGQRRLIEVYSIIKSNTQFVMLDEPFSYLSPLHIEKILTLLHTENSNKGIVITDHLLMQFIDICHYKYLLLNGKLHVVKNKTDIATLGYIPLNT
jgi:ABC-type lipopolysaccharide export system ATPase subunit